MDWPERDRDFQALEAAVKGRGRGYDCVISVSGGKDSTWQVVQCLKYGLHPLAVPWKPPARTSVGTYNLANLISLGVDHIDFQVNAKIERNFCSTTKRLVGILTKDLPEVNHEMRAAHRY